MNEPRAADEVLTPERMLADLDQFFAKIGYANLDPAVSVLNDSIESRRLVSQLKAIVDQEDVVGTDTFDRLIKLYYATSRRLPDDAAISLMQSPKSTRDHFIHYEVKRLFLSVAFKEVLNTYGYSIKNIPPTQWQRIIRVARKTMLFPVKLLGLQVDPNLTRKFSSSQFGEDLYNLGYEKTEEKYLALMTTRYRSRATPKALMLITGSLFSIFITLDLAEMIVSPAASTVKGWLTVPPSDAKVKKMREALFQNWVDYQLNEIKRDGVGAIDSDDYQTTQLYWDTVNNAVVERRFLQLSDSK